MMYKQVIIDQFEEQDYDLGVTVDRTKVLDVDIEEIEDVSRYSVADRFENMFTLEEFINHMITFQLYRLEDDESVDDPVYEVSFRV